MEGIRADFRRRSRARSEEGSSSLYISKVVHAQANPAAFTERRPNSDHHQSSSTYKPCHAKLQLEAGRGQKTSYTADSDESPDSDFDTMFGRKKFWCSETRTSATSW